MRVLRELDVRARRRYVPRQRRRTCVRAVQSRPERHRRHHVDGALGAAQCFEQTTFLTGDFTLLHDLSALALQRELLTHHREVAASDAAANRGAATASAAGRSPRPRRALRGRRAAQQQRRGHLRHAAPGVFGGLFRAAVPRSPKTCDSSTRPVRSACRIERCRRSRTSPEAYAETLGVPASASSRCACRFAGEGALREVPGIVEAAKAEGRFSTAGRRSSCCTALRRRRARGTRWRMRLRAGGAEVLVPDLYACVSPFSMDEACAFLEKAVRLAACEKAHGPVVAGYSMGGRIALETLARVHDLPVAALVLEGTGLGPADEAAREAFRVRGGAVGARAARGRRRRVHGPMGGPAAVRDPAPPPRIVARLRGADRVAHGAEELAASCERAGQHCQASEGASLAALAHAAARGSEDRVRARSLGREIRGRGAACGAARAAARASWALRARGTTCISSVPRRSRACWPTPSADVRRGAFEGLTCGRRRRVRNYVICPPGLGISVANAAAARYHAMGALLWKRISLRHVLAGCVV